jgi:hypothetical protein
MKRWFALSGMVVLLLLSSLPAFAASQDVYSLPEPYLTLEKEYLKAYPKLQPLMDAMIKNSQTLLKDPSQDILHNRVCTALAYQMAVSDKKDERLRMLAPAGDLLHNISKDDKNVLLNDPATLERLSNIVTRLKKAGYFKKSPDFFKDPSLSALKSVSTNLGLIHHLTGAIVAGDILEKAGSFDQKDINDIQAAIIAHSTGYWYFRDSVDEAAKRKGAWKDVYPEPETDLDKYVHDADLISQFERESVAPDGSKWRQLAAKRWGAKDAKEEGHVVYYVFSRLFDEAKTQQGAALAKEQWDAIKPDLLKLMGLAPDQDPLKVLGVPAFWKQ